MVIRGVICNAIRGIDDDIAVQRYIASQLDRHVPEAIFSLYLAMTYHGGDWTWWTLPFSARRCEMLVDALRTDSKNLRWVLELLRCLARRDPDWRTAIAHRAKAEKDVSIRSVLQALSSTKSNVVAKQIFLKALRRNATLTAVEREFCTLLDQYRMELDETQILDALNRNARPTLNLLSNIISRSSHQRLPIKVTQIQEWITLLHKNFTIEEWLTEFSLTVVCSYLARAVPISEHKKILQWANDPETPIRDLVLGLIIPRITGFTTDDLSPESASRLLELYVKGRLEPSPSPGEIATERFITEIVLPYAKSIENDRWEREAIEFILEEAGRRHDRRYYSSWTRARL